MVQSQIQERNLDLANQSAHRDMLDDAVRLASDDQKSHQLIGVIDLPEYWHVSSDESLVAATLAAALIRPGSEDREIRCQAALAIGKAYVEQEGYRDLPGVNQARIQRIAKLLYGTGQGERGIIARLELFFGKPKPTSQEAQASDQCLTQLDAVREAIRMNWEYLVNVNLKELDLRKIQLYRADLLNAILIRTDVTGADFACANLEGSSFQGANWNQIARVEFANVKDAQPQSFREWAVRKGAVEIGDDAWLKWRKSGFPLTADGHDIAPIAAHPSGGPWCGAAVETSMPWHAAAGATK